jgi:hypothetical protein
MKTDPIRAIALVQSLFFAVCVSFTIMASSLPTISVLPLLLGALSLLFWGATLVLGPRIVFDKAPGFAIVLCYMSIVAGLMQYFSTTILARAYLYRHVMGQPQSVSLFLAKLHGTVAVIGSIPAGIGSAMLSWAFIKGVKQIITEQSLGGDSGRTAADGGPTGAPQG